MGYKAITSKNLNEYVLDSETLKHLQNILFQILKDVKLVCEKNNLSYMLAGGTLLGAIRHNGFIPWDDDIDIMMPKKDYNKIAHCILKEFPNKYKIYDPRTDKNCSHKMIKVMLKDTTYIEILSQNFPQFMGIFIDIFPIYNMPEGKRKIRGAIFNFAYHASTVAYEAKYFPSIIKEKSKKNKEMRKFFMLRRTIGNFCRIFFGFKFYMWIALKLADYKKETSLVGMPIGIGYNREVFKKNTFDELIDIEFCGELFKAPKEYDQYLSNLYGDYMQLPPVEKREVHIAYKVEFGNY